MIKKTAQIDHYKKSVSHLSSVTDIALPTICSSMVFNTFPSSVNLVYILVGLNPRCIMIDIHIECSCY